MAATASAARARDLLARRPCARGRRRAGGHLGGGGGQRSCGGARLCGRPNRRQHVHRDHLHGALVGLLLPALRVARRAGVGGAGALACPRQVHRQGALRAGAAAGRSARRRRAGWRACDRARDERVDGLGARPAADAVLAADPLQRRAAHAQLLCGFAQRPAKLSGDCRVPAGRRAGMRRLRGR
eukprot:160041-Chlamydomonas_euryale.AAC.10